jgi:hypothetical protein
VFYQHPEEGGLKTLQIYIREALGQRHAILRFIAIISTPRKILGEFLHDRFLPNPFQIPEFADKLKP